MTKAIVSSTVKPRQLIISDVQQGLVKNQVDQVAILIPMDSMADVFDMMFFAGILDRVVDTRNKPLYSNFVFHHLTYEKEHEVKIIIDGKEYDCIISWHQSEEKRPFFASFFKQKFVIKRNRKSV